MLDRRLRGVNIEAARALIQWKSLFAVEVAEEAKRLAAASAAPEHITLDHYRIAAQSAIRLLLVAVQEGEPSSAEPKAA